MFGYVWILSLWIVIPTEAELSDIHLVSVSHTSLVPSVEQIGTFLGLWMLIAGFFQALTPYKPHQAPDNTLLLMVDPQQ